MGRIASFDDQFAVYILGNLHKTVVIIKESGFIAIGKDLFYRFPAPGKAPQNILLPDVMSAVRNAVLDAQQAFVSAVEADIIQADKIPFYFRLLRGQFCFSAGKRCLLREADVLPRQD